MFGQDQDTVGGGFDPNQAANMYQDGVAIYSRAWDSSEISATKTCVDTADPDLYEFWWGDVTPNNPFSNGNAVTLSQSASGSAPTMSSEFVEGGMSGVC